MANARETPHASPACILACAQILGEIQQQHIVVIDDGWRVLNEYKRKINPNGQPGVGDRFLHWVLINLSNRERCETVTLTPLVNSDDGNDLAEFPQDRELINFDRADRKFVALALTHPEKPPILNATDTDWWHHRAILEKHGVLLRFLCPDAMP
ncbi:MAG: hypothetical protein NT075_31695 [Chloroflexi bacterium]|nr:hypothetical protein [Chloroflexota bacterium]